MKRKMKNVPSNDSDLSGKAELVEGLVDANRRLARLLGGVLVDSIIRRLILDVA